MDPTSPLAGTVDGNTPRVDEPGKAPTTQDRQSLAEAHKRIRLEKVNTGKVLSVQEAQKAIYDEK